MISVRRVALAAAMTTALLTGATVGLAIPAQAHGYISAPYSRALACKMGLNTNCGTIVFEPQSLEAPKGYPQAGPADGRIASAGGAFPQLDEQTFGRWYKNEISPGPLRIDWTYTAPHRTSQWRYYITKQSWDPSGPLERSDFELFATVAHDGSAASNNKVHTVNVPASRSGYHVILAVWDVADTVNAFYNVIDVNITGTGEPADSQPPTVPTNVHSMGETTSTVDLMWDASTDNVGVTGYIVKRNGVEIARPASARFMDAGLSASTAYTYTVQAQDAAGNLSVLSAPFTVTTKAAAPAPSPTATPTPTPTPTQPAATTWSSAARYAVGDRVTFNGVTYVCIQAYQGWGDPNWINAPSLWQVA